MKIKLLLAQVVLIGTVSAGVLDDLNNKTFLRFIQVTAFSSEVMWLSETVGCYNEIKNNPVKASKFVGHLLFNPAVVAVCQMGINNVEKEEQKKK